MLPDKKAFVLECEYMVIIEDGYVGHTWAHRYRPIRPTYWYWEGACSYASTCIYIQIDIAAYVKKTDTYVALSISTSIVTPEDKYRAIDAELKSTAKGSLRGLWTQVRRRVPHQNDQPKDIFFAIPQIRLYGAQFQWILFWTDIRQRHGWEAWWTWSKGGKKLLPRAA